MAKSKKQNNWRIVIPALVLLLVIITAFVYAFNNSVSRTIARIIPYPAALISFHGVSLYDYEQRVALVRTINRGEPTFQERSDILNKSINDKITALEAAKRGVNVSPADINDYYDYLTELTGNRNITKDYGLSESRFKELIVAPDLLSVRLQQKLSEDKDLNKDAYTKLKNVQNALSGGINFEDAAQQFSDDQTSGKLGGEMGFVGLRDITPELYKDLSKVSDQSVHTFVSRYGIHVYKVLGKDDLGPDGTARYHLKQIFIRTQDFSQWLNQTQKNYTIIRLAR